MKLDDLNFEAHPLCSGGTQAKHTFPNGYGVSILTGSMFYTSLSKPYEVAVTKNGDICYDTPITDRVLGRQTATDVEDVMRRVEGLKG